jgi:3-hydroxyisobutyrate dehydrogenase-like beta-hydroxyacid dehydrogenase
MNTTTGGGAGTRVTVLGTGIMGSAMARLLARAGLDTTVWDRTAAATAALAGAGVRVAGSAAEAVAGATVVITMLPDGDAVSGVMFDNTADALADGTAWAQMGTIGVSATEQVAKLHKMQLGDYAPEFPLQWALKDVDLAIEAAGGDAPPPLLAALSRQWRAAVQAGHGREDVSAARLALADGGT